MAIIINNDIEVNVSQSQQRADSDQPQADSDQPQADSDQSQADSDQPRADSGQPRADSDQPRADSDQSQAGGAQSISLPTTPNSDQVRCTLEALGYHVLYFNSLTSDNIERLLDAFSKADHTDLATFGLIVFSKGKSPHIYDADNEKVPFEKIFKHFQNISDLPKFCLFHLNGTSTEDIQLPDPPSKSIALAVSVDSPQSDISPAVRSFESEMKNDVCYKEPIVDVFNKIAAQCRQNGKCEVKSTFHNEFILPVRYEAANKE